METFKVNLKGTLMNLMQLEISLLTAGSLDRMTFRSLFCGFCDLGWVTEDQVPVVLE